MTEFEGKNMTMVSFTVNTPDYTHSRCLTNSQDYDSEFRNCSSAINLHLANSLEINKTWSIIRHLLLQRLYFTLNIWACIHTTKAIKWNNSLICWCEVFRYLTPVHISSCQFTNLTLPTFGSHTVVYSSSHSPLHFSTPSSLPNKSKVTFKLARLSFLVSNINLLSIEYMFLHFWKTMCRCERGQKRACMHMYFVYVFLLHFFLKMFLNNYPSIKYYFCCQIPDTLSGI